VGFEDKGQGFPKKIFNCSKLIVIAVATDLRKTAVLSLSSKQSKKNIF
jgi:hypothetical protein